MDNYKKKFYDIFLQLDINITFLNNYYTCFDLKLFKKYDKNNRK